MSFLPGLGIAKGMALTLKRFFEPKVTIKYPEETPDVAVKFRGRLQLLYDEWGTLKCETCFQCAQACPIECIDMGGVDTKGRYHIHWGAPETYGERREESALRRSGRPVPDEAYEHFAPTDLSAVDEILARYDHDPKDMLLILEATQLAYGYLPVAALKHISSVTGAWYAMIYGTATFYRHLRFDQPVESIGICRCTSCLLAGSGRIQEALERALGTQLGAPPTGRIRIEQLPTHTEGTAPPVVTFGGQPQQVTVDTVERWADRLAADDRAGDGRGVRA
ncbi:MAG: NAD(P)H-dependent oxidoreductase subunit E [Candidatus Limnocylindrales bacterium]